MLASLLLLSLGNVTSVLLPDFFLPPLSPPLSPLSPPLPPDIPVPPTVIVVSELMPPPPTPLAVTAITSSWFELCLCRLGFMICLKETRSCAVGVTILSARSNLGTTTNNTGKLIPINKKVENIR